MSNFTSYSSSSFSYSSSSSSSNGQTSGKAYHKETHSNPQGTTTRTTSQNMGEPMIQETRHFDASGRELLGSGQAATRPAIEQPRGRVEEIDESDADRAYRQKMEDEYAKREGGA